MNDITEMQDFEYLCETTFGGDYDAVSVNELLDCVYAVNDTDTRSLMLDIALTAAQQHRKATRFKQQHTAYKKSYMENKQSERVTGQAEITSVPSEYAELLKNYSVGDYVLDDTGVYKPVITKDGDFMLRHISGTPLFISELLDNVQENNEKVRLIYRTEPNIWRNIAIEREIPSSNTKITRLANYGIDVTTDTAKELVSFMQALMRENNIPVCKTIDHLGWYNNEFIPYSRQYNCDNVFEFGALYNSVCCKGDYDIWVKHCTELRDNIYLRLVMAASFASVLIDRIGVLPFVVHIWGGSGAGKTVALNVAASIWGNSVGGLVRTMNGTVYGISETAAFLYSLPCILDELQTVVDGNVSLNSFIMRLCEGMSKTQGKTNGGVRNLKHWRNCFISSGEENIIKSNSGGGTVNRVISLEIKDGDTVIMDGNYTMSVVSENYGHAGKVFIESLKSEQSLNQQYKVIYRELQTNTDGTDKQCMTMACLMLADTLAVKYIFKNDKPLEIEDLRPFIISKQTVDIVERCYNWVFDWIAKNYNRFENLYGSEVWGRIDNDFVYINKAVFTEALSGAGFDYGAVISAFAERGYIEKDTQGRFAHYTAIQNIRAAYIKLRLNTDFEYIQNDTNNPFIYNNF